MAEYEVSDDPDRVDLDAVWAFVSTEAYWGRYRTREDVEKQVRGAWRVVGAYVDDAQVGFCRAVSDGVALAYLADVYVLPAHRGHGLGRRLVHAMVADGPGVGFRWLLHTSDAHDLYRQFGFREPDTSVMELPHATSRGSAS